MHETSCAPCCTSSGCRHMADGMEADTLECVYLLPLSYRRLEKEGFALLFQEMNAAFAT